MNERICDPSLLTAFVRGELDALAEHELTKHLDECESCGQTLEHKVAESAAWQEASRLLGNGALQIRDASHDHEDRLDEQIEQVLAQLDPTDDPESLGRIGGYEVTGAVGVGGMGVVLKAYDRTLDRIVAIKVMSPHLASSGSARKRFAREAKAAAAVLHPNVIAIHSVASEDANPYLVMPFVRGTSLQKRIDTLGPLPLKDTLRIGAQIAAGLSAAHEQGLVHRDIKPANILLEEGVERVTITDFGLARAVDDASMTCSGVIAGTPQYMSPEQARGESIDARSDLFSFGSVMYAMCTGRPPFRAETTYGVLHRITNDKPTPICEVNTDVPVWLGHVSERLMAKRPEDRFESAAQVAELLESCLAHVQQPAAIPLPASVIALAPKKTRRPPIGKFIAAAVFGLAFIFAGVFVVLELNKGTLTIQSDVDDIRVRITSSEEVVNELKVTKFGKNIRIAAGQYNIEVIGETDDIAIQNGQVTLHRAETEVVRITHNTHNTHNTETLNKYDVGKKQSANECMAQLQGRWYVEQKYLENGILKRYTSSAIVRGNRMEITQHGASPMTFGLVFGETGPPQQIDLRPFLNDAEQNELLRVWGNLDDAPPQELLAPSFKGIIDLEKDGFRMCTFKEPGATRPSVFTHEVGLVAWNFIRLPTGTSTLDSKQPVDEQGATKPIPPGARAFGGYVARYMSLGSARNVEQRNGDMAFEARGMQNLDGARIHLCKVTLAREFAERDKVEVIQTISSNTDGRFSGFIPREYTSLFERKPSDPFLALVVEAEGCITDSRSSLPEHWNNDMNFGLEPNEKIVKGQILVDGNPADSVSVTAISVERAYPDEMDAFLKEVKSKPIDEKVIEKQAFYDGPNPLPLGLAKTNVIISAEHTATDNQGKFELRGFGPNDVLTLEIEGRGVEKTWLRVINRDIDRINLRHISGSAGVYYGCGLTYAHAAHSVIAEDKTAPSVVVVRSSFPNAQAILLDNSANQIGSISELGMGPAVSLQNVVMIDVQHKRLLFVEGSRDRLAFFDYSGKERLTIPIHVPNGVFLTHDASQIGCMSGESITKRKTTFFDAVTGEEIRFVNCGGLAMTNDVGSSCIWSVGTQLILFDPNGEISVKRPLAQLPVELAHPAVINSKNWSAVGVAMEPNPNAWMRRIWVIERAHPDVKGSKNRLYAVDRDGQTRILVDLEEVDPTSIVCATSSDGFCRILIVDGKTGDLVSFNADGESMGKVELDVQLVAFGETSGLWVAGNLSVRKLNPSDLSVVAEHKFLEEAAPIGLAVR